MNDPDIFILALTIYSKGARMPDNVDRAESAKGTRDYIRYYARASPACFFAATNPIYVACTPIQSLITLSAVTIQFPSCEVRLHVFTTGYACYAFSHDTITHSRTYFKVTNSFRPISYVVSDLYTGSFDASCDARTNFLAVANTCATSHPSQAPQAFYAITPKNDACRF